MTQESDHFEKQIQRIKTLLEGSGAIVKWNDKIPDPDNPKQLRQIDITIKNGTKLTLVECRIHKKVQDVKWVEELIGRKISLKANKLIAVSASGFTSGAKKKAEKYGIFLRDLYTLTEEEIQNWGNNSTITFGAFKYEDLKISILFDKKYVKKVKDNKVFKKVKNSRVLYIGFNAFKNALRQSGAPNPPEKRTIKIDFKHNVHKIAGYPVAGINIEAVVSEEKFSFVTSSIISYGKPEAALSNREARIEGFDFKGFEITKANGSASLCIDLSSVPFTPDFQFNEYVRVDFGSEFKFAPDDIEMIANDQKQLYFSKGVFRTGIVEYG